MKGGGRRREEEEGGGSEGVLISYRSKDGRAKGRYDGTKARTHKTAGETLLAPDGNGRRSSAL
jgi:hypothetical protein